MADFDPPPSLSITDAMGEIATHMINAGIETVIDPAELAIPGAVVYPNLIDYDTLAAGSGNGYELTVDIVLIAGNASALAALDQLDTMLASLRALWPIGEARAVTANLGNQSPDPLPALSVTLTVQVLPQEEL